MQQKQDWAREGASITSYEPTQVPASSWDVHAEHTQRNTARVLRTEALNHSSHRMLNS